MAAIIIVLLPVELIDAFSVCLSVVFMKERLYILMLSALPILTVLHLPISLKV